MAAHIPAKLKSADIQRFATRAAQLEKYRPIVTYWCNYHIVNQILGKGLHTADDECMAYTTTVMDKLEVSKTEYVNEPAVVDDVAAKAYVEQFALETFERADSAQRASKVTRQTADTFQAAATFLDLMGTWQPVETEITQKSKFAKFHALRIAKAIKAGEDPNASNPVMEEAPARNDAEMDNGLEQELRDLENAQRPGEGGVYMPPSVESAPASNMPSRSTSIPPTGSPFALPPLPSRAEVAAPPPQQEHDVSPIEPTRTVTDRQGSIGGGYFPSVPPSTSTYDTAMSSAQSPERDHEMMTPPEQPPTDQSPPQAPIQQSQHQQLFSPGDFYNTPIAPSALSVRTPSSLSGMPNFGNASAPPAPWPSHAVPPPTPPTARAPVAQHVPPVAHHEPLVTHPAPSTGGYRDDDESVLAAQKHAKWAISALHFEDVNTAVKELRLALYELGAR